MINERIYILPADQMSDGRIFFTRTVTGIMISVSILILYIDLGNRL